MRISLIAFCLGVWWLQQQPELPPARWLWLLPLLLPLLWLPACSRPLAEFLRRLGVALLCVALGFAWAAWRADARLAERLSAHWQGVVASACEQCGRNQVPGVAAPLPLASWLAQYAGGRLLFLSPLAEARLVDLPRPVGTDCLVAGPEGGFEADELAVDEVRLAEAELEKAALKEIARGKF